LQAARDIIRAANVGDVLLTTRRGSLTSRLIPGFWSHAAIVVDGDAVVHATYPNVSRSSITELVLGATDVMIVRPVFADGEQRGTAIRWALMQLGHPYDLGFEHGVDAFYCSELVWLAYGAAVPEWSFDARKRLGVATVTPQDLADADDHFARIIRRPAPRVF
jgi:uncharacterized protein YycO